MIELTLIIWQCIRWRLAVSTHPKPRLLQLTKENLIAIYDIVIFICSRWSNIPLYVLCCKIRFISMLVLYTLYHIDLTWVQCVYGCWLANKFIKIFDLICASHVYISICIYTLTDELKHHHLLNHPLRIVLHLALAPWPLASRLPLGLKLVW